MSSDPIKQYLDASSRAVGALEAGSESIRAAAEKIIHVYRTGGKVLTLGCGGSAADAQHIAAELVCRFRKNRRALPCIALTTNPSLITAVSNDYDFSEVFSRQIEALAMPGDAVILLSTSGNSPSVLNAADAARERNAAVISMTGKSGGALKEKSDITITAPSEVTSHVQECHQAVFHIICLLVEDDLFPDG